MLLLTCATVMLFNILPNDLPIFGRIFIRYYQIIVFVRALGRQICSQIQIVFSHSLLTIDRLAFGVTGSIGLVNLVNLILLRHRIICKVTARS